MVSVIHRLPWQPDILSAHALSGSIPLPAVRAGAEMISATAPPGTSALPCRLARAPLCG